ncbi:MAG: FAD-binding protein, partial [Candidatus Marinimicrobia bacterium]|nr:FAD-binding protein [Candidatus Neomarinimicrobiota bacterium]
MSKPSDNSQLIRNFSEILGSEQILTDPADRIVYECDGLVLNKRMPDVVVLPRTTEEIAAIVKICNQHDVPYLARGAGTGLSGGAVAYNGGVILQLSRMNQILEIDYDDEIAVVQPGVVNIQLSDLTTEAGYHFAPDPSSQKACTIGGNVAENAGGPHTLKYGVTTDHILGLTMVMPDGSVETFGGRCEDIPGYDLVGLMVGSEGTLGIVTEITARLTMNPKTVQTFLAVYDSIE